MKPIESDEGTSVVPSDEQDAGQTRAQDRLPPVPAPGSGR